MCVPEELNVLMIFKRATAFLASHEENLERVREKKN